MAHLEFLSDDFLSRMNYFTMSMYYFGLLKEEHFLTKHLKKRTFTQDHPTVAIKDSKAVSLRLTVSARVVEVMSS